MFEKKIKKTFRRIFHIPSAITINQESIVKSLVNLWGHLLYKQHYTSSELVKKMESMGMKKGSCIFIHSTWDAFFNYEGTEVDLIDMILDSIGPKGTLAMPAYPLFHNKTFNVRKSVTGAGMLAEEFRKYPGVKRSVNTQHSVCAIGPLSDYLLSEHHLGETCWDEKSPYYKLSQVNAIIFCLGLGHSYLGTMIHCVESINRERVPYYQSFFSEKKNRHVYIDYDGIEKEYYCYDITVERLFKPIPGTFFIRRYFNKDCFRFSRISNLTINAYQANLMIPRLIDLGKKGIDLYRKPSKKGYIFLK